MTDVDRWKQARRNFKSFVAEYYRLRKNAQENPSEENRRLYRIAQVKYKTLVADMHASERKLGYERVAEELEKLNGEQ